MVCATSSDCCKPGSPWLRRRYFSWQLKAHWKRLGLSGQGQSSLQRTLCEEFEGVRAFHACRPVSVAAYYTEGIKGHSPHFLLQEALRAFGPLYSVREIEDQFSDGISGLRDVTYCGIDARTLVRGATHYLIYGSEHLNGVAAGLDRTDFGPARQLLAQRGTPTVLECFLPWQLLDNAVVPNFVGALAETILQQAPLGDGIEWADFTCFVAGGVPADRIGRHWHLHWAPDVFRGDDWVRLAGQPCDMCEQPASRS